MKLLTLQLSFPYISWYLHGLNFFISVPEDGLASGGVIRHTDNNEARYIFLLVLCLAMISSEYGGYLVLGQNTQPVEYVSFVKIWQCHVRNPRPDPDLTGGKLVVSPCNILSQAKCGRV